MSHTEKPIKISKVLRSKAQEFLASSRSAESLLDFLEHFDSGADLSSCLLTVELIFTTLLKEKQMVIEIIPLKPIEHTQENENKMWLKNIYEECFNKVLKCMENESQKIQTQGLSTAMNLISHEGKFPLEKKGNFNSYVPVPKLRSILMKLLSNKQNNTVLINKYTEYLMFDDVLYFTWKMLPLLTAKCNPNEVYIMNYLVLMEKLQLTPNKETQYLSCDGQCFEFDKAGVVRSLNRLWNCVMLWDHTPETHKQLLIVLLERVLPHLEKPLLMTDFLMDSLDVGGPVSLLALQGIFTMIQIHNLNYPNIFGKLYSMFEPEIFHTKYKARLFYLADIFLSSSHLPENLVAAFAKRLARLALVAPSEDVIIICMFIGNLILSLTELESCDCVIASLEFVMDDLKEQRLKQLLHSKLHFLFLAEQVITREVRHPGLKCLLNNVSGSMATNDPYIMEECDPVKSNAIKSSLWEIQSLQNHVLPSVATAAKFISFPLPSVEWDLSTVLDSTGDDIFDKEVKKFSMLIVLAFDRPNGISLSKGEKVLQYWNL